jgi:hypothetical protein
MDPESKEGWCVLRSEDAANFVFRALKLLDRAANVWFDHAQDEEPTDCLPIMSAQSCYFTGA